MLAHIWHCLRHLSAVLHHRHAIGRFARSHRWRAKAYRNEAQNYEHPSNKCHEVRRIHFGFISQGCLFTQHGLRSRHNSCKAKDRPRTKATADDKMSWSENISRFSGTFAIKRFASDALKPKTVRRSPFEPPRPYPKGHRMVKLRAKSPKYPLPRSRTCRSKLRGHAVFHQWERRTRSA